MLPSVVANEKLTSAAFWNDHWETAKLPHVIKRSTNPFVRSQNDSILDVFDAHLPTNRFSMLEIGGAPGQFLGYFKQTYECDVAALDFSEAGCRKTRGNFELLGLPVVVHERDLFGDLGQTPQYDVVYSLGFLEHFTDTAAVVGRHIALVKPGGLLFLGVPSLLGINHWLVGRLTPSLLDTHYLPSMEIDSWQEFERVFRLQCLSRSYIGGFEPRMFWRRPEDPTIPNRLLRNALRALGLVLRLKSAKVINSRRFSGYAMGVYRVPA